MKRRIIFFCLTVLVSLSSCKKDEEENNFIISLVKYSPSQIIEFEENINIKISYSHDKGYVGFFDPDYLSLEVKDSRLPNADYYPLIPLSPPGDAISIQGEILLEVDAPFIFGNGNVETLTFTIRIQDKDKNWSNSITTGLITINKQ